MRWLGGDAVHVSAPRRRDNRSLELKLCLCLNVKPLGCGVFVCTIFFATRHSSGLVLGRQCQSVSWLVQFGPDWNIPVARGRTALTFGTDIRGPQWIDPTDVAVPLTFSSSITLRFNVTVTIRLTAMKCCTFMVCRRWTNFGNPHMSFSPVPQAGFFLLIQWNLPTSPTIHWYKCWCRNSLFFCRQSIVMATWF